MLNILPISGILCLVIPLPLVLLQTPPRTSYRRLNCPLNWVKMDDFRTSRNVETFTCYKFIRSPKKSYQEARELCRTYKADLMTINTNDEHGFIVRYLHENDPLRREWYVGVVQKSPGYWENEDGTPLLESIQKEFLPNDAQTFDRRYLAYGYSYEIREWGLLMTTGAEPKEFICEISSNLLGNLILDAEEIRDHEYGMAIQDPRFIPRGPRIIKQPEAAMFDLLKRDVINFISITCLADGFPAPTYEWFKEEYKANRLEAIRIDPLLDARFTVSGGTLIINLPKEIEDRGNYFCKSSNQFGSVVSQSVQLSFAYMAEFNLKRSDENGNRNWGKAIYCDPPRYFPDARFYWNRDFFPNFVEEDRRTLVSFDGNLYFSYLDKIDEGLYSCTVQSTVSDIGRHGPFFRLNVYPHSNYQQLKFANNFPKAFPDSPVRGDDVRLECIAFGYPVPYYNWTRRNGDLPRGAELKNFNRVLILPNVQPADVGEYICRAENTRLAIDGSVSLSIQATPTFTIPLHDNFIAEGEDLMMECEAFAIPDVTYTWLRNAEPLVIANLSADLQGRYEMRDNVLKILRMSARDEATYQCKATNQLDSSYSSSQLRVLKLGPSFIKRPLKAEMYAAISTNITIRCRPEAAPVPDFEWRKDGLKLGSTGTKHTILRNGDLIITFINRDDRGFYNCTATNKYGSDYSSGELIVLDEPLLINHPPEFTYSAVGNNLFLRCEARMDEILDVSYIWQHNEQRIEVDIYEDPHRRIVYEDNYYTDFYSRRQLDDTSALRNKEKLGSLYGYVSRREPPFISGYYPGTLIIRNLTLEDSGFYMCDARSPIANVSYTTKVIILGPPGPVGGISALDMTSTTARLRWTNGADNGYPTLFYTIEGMTLYTNIWKIIAENITAIEVDKIRNEMEYQLPERSLTPWASYKFRIKAINELGNGIYSAPSPTANTREDVPFLPPAGVGGGGGKTGDLTITWQPLPLEEQNGPGIYYRVFWRRFTKPDPLTPEEPFKQQILAARGNIGMFVTPIEEHYFYTEYEVKVQSANRNGWGPISDAEIIFSAEDMPQVQPTEVKAWAYNATSLNITWKPIEPTRENIRGKLIGYRLKYWREEDAETDAQIRLNNGTRPYGLVVGLVPNTYYWVRVMAYNGAGSGPESEKFRERTWRYPPLTPPNAVEVSPIDPETIYVKWRGITPTAIEEALIGYKVRIWLSDQDMTTANDTIIPIGQPLEAYLTGLELGKMYKLRVLAYSLGGDGKMSSPPIHFSMGDPEKLTAEAIARVIPVHIIYLLPMVIFLRK